MGLRMASSGGATAPQGGGQEGHGGGDNGGGTGGGGGGLGGGQGGGHFAPGRGRDGGTQGQPGQQQQRRDGQGQQGGGSTDYRALHQQQQRQLQEQQRTIEQLSRQFGEHQTKTQSSTEVLDRIRDAINGGKEAAQKGADPVQGWEQQLDYYLAQAVEAEKAGAAIPLTTNLAVQLFQNLIAHHQEKQAWQQDLGELKAAVKQQGDPQTRINQQAFGQIDTFVRRGLDQLYGAGQEMGKQKAALFDAVGQSISDEIAGLSQQNFLQWDAIRRDPAMMQQLVQKHLASIVPPGAMKLLEDQRLQSTPMKMGELRQAFAEARQIQDPAKRSEIMEAIRQDIWQAMYASGKLKLRDQ